METWVLKPVVAPQLRTKTTAFFSALGDTDSETISLSQTAHEEVAVRQRIKNMAMIVDLTSHYYAQPRSPQPCYFRQVR